MSSRTGCSLNLTTSLYHDYEDLKRSNGISLLQSALIQPNADERNLPEGLSYTIYGNLCPVPAETYNNFCTICEKIVPENLLEHTQSHFQSITGRCERCSRIFDNYEKFREHAKKHPRIPITYDTSDEEIEETIVKEPEKNKNQLLEEEINFEISEKLPWSDHAEPSDDDDDGNVSNTSRITWPWKDPGSEFDKDYSHGKLCKFCMTLMPYCCFDSHYAEHLKGAFLCEICGICFPQYKSYKRHNYKHNVHLQCPHCGRRSKSDSNLRCHIAMEHTGEATHTCSFCSKKFFNQRHLKNHEKRHMNILDFECEVCNKRFFNKFARRSHMRQHTDEKPFRCKCGEAFRHNVSLKAHQKSKHGIKEEETVPCSKCDRKFASWTAMLTHLRKHPSDDKPKGKRKRKRKSTDASKDVATSASVQSKGTKKRKGKRSEEEQNESPKS